MLIVPGVGGAKPASRRMSVLLPHPEGPIMTVSLPRSIVNEQSRTTVFANWAAPYDLLTSCTSISATASLAARWTGAAAEGGGTCGKGMTVIALIRLDLSSLAQPGGHQLAELAQQCARNVAGNADADHADHNLGVGSADVRIPDEEAEPAALGATHGARAAAPGNHLRGDDYGPGNADAHRGADD